MATTNPSVVRAIRATLNLYDTVNTGLSIPYRIGNIYAFDENNTAVTVYGSPPLDGGGTPVYPVTSATGVVENVEGSGPWTATLTGMTSTAGLTTGDNIKATSDVGSVPNGSFVTEIFGSDSLSFTKAAAYGAQAPQPGAVTDIVNFTAGNTASVPPGWESGVKVVIAGVEGMPELATAGENGTNAFYIGSSGDQIFQLYTDASLSTPVNATGFQPAVPNTGTYQPFLIPSFVTKGNSVTVTYDNYTAVETQVDLNFDTGQFSLDANYTYSFSAVGYLSGVSYGNTVVPTYQWYNVTTQEYVGNPAPIGSRITYDFTTTVETVFELRALAPNGGNWEYSATLTNIQATVQTVSGFIA